MDIAIGSFIEAEYQFRLGKDLGFVPQERYAPLKEKFGELGRCLYGLARGLDGR